MGWFTRRRRARRRRILPDAYGKVVPHLPCVGCEYNLRGVAMEGACPECGRPVADSVRDEDTLPPLP